MKNIKKRVLNLAFLFLMAMTFSTLSANAETRNVKNEGELQKALNTKAVNQVNLEEDIRMTSNFVDSSDEMTINGNGYKINASHYYYIFKSANAKVTFKDVEIYNSNPYNSNGSEDGFITFYTGKELNLKNVTFKGKRLAVTNGANTTMENLNFQGTSVSADGTGSLTLLGENDIQATYVSYNKRFTIGENSKNEINVENSLAYFYNGNSNNLTIGENSLSNINSENTDLITILNPLRL